MEQVCRKLKSKSARAGSAEECVPMTAKQQYRSEIGIMRDILGIIVESGRDGAIISAISRMANVSYNSVNGKCQKLVEANLIESVKDGRVCTFFITEQGVAFFEQLCRFTDMMRAANIRY